MEIVKTASQCFQEKLAVEIRLRNRIRKERAVAKRQDAARQHPFAAFADAFVL